MGICEHLIDDLKISQFYVGVKKRNTVIYRHKLRARWVLGALAALVVSGSVAAIPVHAANLPLPQVTILFSRTEMTAADGNPCQPDDTNIARLNTVVAPYLAILHISGTGTVETGPTRQTSDWCSHYGESEAASWDEMTNLSANYGWAFVSHSSTYPSLVQWAAMSPAQVYAETCGSEQVISSHYLPGANGLFAWPDNKVAPNALSDVESCYDTSRRYGQGITTESQVKRPPYYQWTRQLIGGNCTDLGSPCSQVTLGFKYSPPVNAINLIRGLQPGQWLTIQVYVLVSGTSPAYTTNKDRWDCTSSNSADHWSNDAERYCYSDFQQVMQALAARVSAGQVQVNDPAGVAGLFGRSATAASRAVSP